MLCKLNKISNEIFCLLSSTASTGETTLVIRGCILNPLSQLRVTQGIRQTSVQLVSAPWHLRIL